MFVLMTYFLLQPLIFIINYPDLVMFTDADYWGDVVLLQFGLAFITYFYMFLSWIGLVAVIIYVIVRYFIDNSFQYTALIVGLVAGGASQWLTSLFAAFFSWIYYHSWVIPRELRYL